MYTYIMLLMCQDEIPLASYKALHTQSDILISSPQFHQNHNVEINNQCDMEVSQLPLRLLFYLLLAEWRGLIKQPLTVSNTLQHTDADLVQRVRNFTYNTFSKSFSSSLQWFYEYLHTPLKELRSFLPKRHERLLSSCIFRFQMLHKIVNSRLKYTRYI